MENRLPTEMTLDLFPGQSLDNLGQPSSHATRFVARHDRRGNLVFVDGHAETVRVADVIETRVAAGSTRGGAIMPQTRIVWTPDPSADPNCSRWLEPQAFAVIIAPLCVFQFISWACCC